MLHDRYSYCAAVPRAVMAAAATWIALCAPAPLSAQPWRPPPPSPDSGGVGMHAIGLFTQATPAVEGEARDERYLTQPMVMLYDPGATVTARAMINFEAWTLKGGELNAGNWGEGFVDRRHPHTVLHELMLSVAGDSGPVRYSLAGGRGFVPFGSDDPMVRPFVKFPSNHHLAQILERWLLIAGIGAGPLVLEGAVFNGDEPTGPRSTGKRERFGDSWSVRATWWPFDAVELQAGRAVVESPEHAEGGGLDHRKWHAGMRVNATLGGLDVYGLGEWARTDEHAEAVLAFSFASTLVEVAVAGGPYSLAARWERSTRPEEERIEDPFRSARPHAGDNILGVTRWRSVTLHLARGGGGEFAVSPFLEVSRLTVEEITGAIFDPATFYGDRTQWSLSAGLRLGIGLGPVRAGRYGVALRDHEHPAAMHAP